MNNQRRDFLKKTSFAFASLINPFDVFANNKKMKENQYEVIIIGGSLAGLQAAMSLGRALRQVLIIDSGKPCNINTPHSHNFITHDGTPPLEILAEAKSQVIKYKTVKFFNGLAKTGIKTENGFEIGTQSGEKFIAKKLIFATGVKDIMPNISGFAECWGNSVIHCPYCHGYEYSHEKTGILANGDMAFEIGRLINNWTKDLTIFTNGKSTLTGEQLEKLQKHAIKIVENEIQSITHEKGQIKHIVFKDGSQSPLKAMYARPQFEQHCDIPAQLGCEFTELKHIKVDPFQKTNIPNIYACGDNTTIMRSVANAVAMGAMAGAICNSELIVEEF
jgi:thioredoxin reductase